MASLNKIVFIVLAILILWVLIAPGCMTFRTPDEKAIRVFAKLGLELKTNFLQVKDRKMHFVAVGNDSLPTLVMIHGSPSTWSSFLAYLQDSKLLKHYRIVAIDRPGFGYSDFGKALHIAEQAHYLMAVVKSIKNNKPLYLAGHSLGGPLAIKMAADNPELFSGIMLISGSVDPALEPKEYWRFAMEKFPFNYLLPGSFKASNTELVYFKEDVKKLVADFEKVKCPVYLVHGNKDHWVPPGNVEFAKEKLVNAQKVETLMLPGNHFIPWTQKKEIINEMIKMQEN